MDYEQNTTQRVLQYFKGSPPAPTILQTNVSQTFPGWLPLGIQVDSYPPPHLPPLIHTQTPFLVHWYATN